MKATRPRLRLRLLLSAAVTIFAALGIAWLVMVMLFDRHLERRAKQELTAMAAPLLAELEADSEGRLSLETYPTDPRFELPGSGLYWQVQTNATALRSRSLWDESLPSPPIQNDDGWSHIRVPGPFDHRVLQVSRTIKLNGAIPPATVSMGMDERQLIDARNLFGGEMAAFLLLLWLALAMAAWIQVTHGLRPLAHVRQELDGLQQNAHARLSDRHPVEITPLTTAINALAEMRERDLERARRSAADLAHALKTPLTALRAVSHEIRATGISHQADSLDTLIDETRSAIDAELRRARINGVHRRAHASTTHALDVVERVISVVSRTPAGKALVFDVAVNDDQSLPASNEDLLEMLGAMVENAARYANRQVRISVTETPEGTILSVEDDGKGIDSTASEAFARGARLDTTGSNNYGMGLAIVRELAEATGGRVSLNHASLGGLRIALLWKPI